MYVILTVFLSRVTELMNRPATHTYTHNIIHTHPDHTHTDIHTTNGHVGVEVVQLPTFVRRVSKELDEFGSVPLLVGLWTKISHQP